MKLSDFIKELQKYPEDSEIYFQMSDGCCGDKFELLSPWTEGWNFKNKGTVENYLNIVFPALPFLETCISSGAAQRRGESVCKRNGFKAISFDELVEYGKSIVASEGGTIINGMPWSFDYEEHPITNEDEDCFLVCTLKGIEEFEHNDLLITGNNQEIYILKRDKIGG